MNQSVALFKSHQRAVYDELCKTRPKTFNNMIGAGVAEGTLSKSKLSQVSSVKELLNQSGAGGGSRSRMLPSVSAMQLHSPHTQTDYENSLANYMRAK